MNSTLTIILTAISVSGSSAHAAIIAQDDFTYVNGSLHGNGSAGSGWAGAWTLDTGTGLTIANGAVAPNPNNSRTFRNLTDTQGTDNMTIYIGFDYEFGTHFSAIEFNLGNANNTNFRLENNNNFGGGPRFRPEAAGGGNGLAVVNQAGIRRYVIQVDYGVAGADTATLFDNGVSVGSISATGTGLPEGFAFNQVSFGAFGGGVFNHADNLIIATTFNEAALIPEPSTAFLGGLGLLALLRRRR